MQQFIRYGITGVISNIIVYVIFIALIYLNVEAIHASVMCYFIGLCLSYLVNRRWTFNSNQKHKHDIVRFMLAYGIGLIATWISMSILVAFLRPEIAQLITILIVAIIIFTTLKLLRFGGTRNDRIT